MRIVEAMIGYVYFCRPLNKTVYAGKDIRTGE